MTVLRHIIYCLLLSCGQASLCLADLELQDVEDQSSSLIDGADQLMVEHLDVIKVDPELTLPQLLERTLEKYPDRLINEALTKEADALTERSDSWFAGSKVLQLEYNDDRVGNDVGAREGSAKLLFTVWNWGQRSAAQDLAHQSSIAADKQSKVVRLEVARLVREALWNMTLAEIRLEVARNQLQISEQLTAKVRRRVELGDLPRADLLLAESDHLQNQTLLTQAEAELMHSRKSYTSLTQTVHIPANYAEQQSDIHHIQPNHPMLEAINAFVARKQATIEWAKTTDTVNQPKVSIGAKSTRDQRGGDDMQSINVGVEIPFGHSTYDAPEIAAAYLELNQALAQREHLHRQLEKGLHEAEHNLEVNRKELALAQQMKSIAEQHLKMMQISFESGEINLLDLLKIQGRSLEAIRNAREQEVNLQRNVALYNQAVGVLP
ncbi:MAG: TolC family protein [Gammaproteobacteria bacterium]